MNEFTQKKSKSKHQGQPVYAGGHIVGKVVGDIFYKTISGSRHFLRQPPAIACDVSTLDQAAALGASKVVIRDRETGREYRASIAYIKTNGFELDRGFGRQLALTMDYWTSNRPDKPQQLSFLPGTAGL